MPNKPMPELLKARVVGGDGKSTKAELFVFGKSVALSWDGPGHGEKALLWAQKWDAHCKKSVQTIQDTASFILEKFVDALLDKGVDFAVIEEALDSVETGDPNNG